MRRDAGHPDYVGVDMTRVATRAQHLASTDAPTIPSGLVELLEADEEVTAELFSGVDKAATPAERLHSPAELLRDMERARPQSLVAQRDSDANRDVASSRNNALSQFSTLSLQTGSNLMSQFETSYIPRVFCTTLPWCVGGPDFKGSSWRRVGEAPIVSLDAYTAMMASRCEYPIRADWDFNPGLFSLAFASKVDLGQSMSIQRALRRGAHGPEADAEIGAATVRIYKLLWEGEYINAAGQRTIYLTEHLPHLIQPTCYCRTRQGATHNHARAQLTTY